VSLRIEQELASKFPGLSARVIHIRGVEVKGSDLELEEFKVEVIRRAKERWTLDQLREHQMFRAYRDFFWRIGVDPTKIRPAAEALIRRVLRGRPIPKINTLVDAYNAASIDTAIALGAFDLDGLSGELIMREAVEGEEFLGIGMKDPIVLKGVEAVVADNEKLIAVYPYRDAEECKVIEDTVNVLLMVCGVPNIDGSNLDRAESVSVDYITKFCGGSEA
jgi:DNA/RNA-binding domain of Phe-tRNA-synthetase-like protein